MLGISIVLRLLSDPLQLRARCSHPGLSLLEGLITGSVILSYLLNYEGRD
jgi:hypothetical protein